MSHSETRKDDAAVGSRLAAWALLAALPLLFLAPTILRDEALIPGSQLFGSLPWAAVRPADLPPNPYPLGDQIVQFHPWRTLAAEALSRGRLPLWDPYANCGSPLLANGQSAPLFPSRLFDLLLPVTVASWATVAFKLLVALLGTAWYARLIGLSPAGAVAAAVAFGFGGFTMVWLGHPHTNAAVFLPVLLALCEKVLRAPPGRSGPIAGLAAGIGLQFLGGHPETSFHALLAVGVYCLVRLAQDAASRHAVGPAAARGAMLLGAALLGLLLASIALLPLLEYIEASSALFVRNAKIAHGVAATHPLSPRAAIGLVFPRFYGVDPNRLAELGLRRQNNFVEMSGGFAGVAALLGAVTAASTLRHRRGVVFWAVTILVCALLVYDLGPLSAWLAGLPLLDIAANRRFLLVMLLGLAVLFGVCVDRVASPEPLPRPVTIVAAVAAGAALLGFAVIGYRQATEELSDVPTRLDLVLHGGAAAAFLAIVLLRSRGILRPNLLGGALVVVALVELLGFARGINRGVDETQLFPETPLIAWLKEQTADGARICPQGGVLPPDTPTVPRLRSVKGYDAVEIRVYTELLALLSDQPNEAQRFVNIDDTLERIDAPVLDRLAVRYVLSPAGEMPAALPDGLAHVTTLDGVDVIENQNALGRAHVVGAFRVIADPRARLRALRTYDPRREVILEEEIEPLPEGAADGAGEAHLVVDGMEHVVVEADGGATGGLLVLADADSPGWTATIERLEAAGTWAQGGADVPILRADHALRAVRLGPGRQRVTFRYAPASVRRGAWMSAGALVMILLILTILPRLARRRRAG